MKDAGPLEVNLVVVHRNCPNMVGDIVVAFVDGAVTVKFLRQAPIGPFCL